MIIRFMFKIRHPCIRKREHSCKFCKYGKHHYYELQIMKPQQRLSETLIKQQQREKQRAEKYADILAYIQSNTFETMGEDEGWDERFCENSLVVLNQGEKITAFIPSYVRCHFRKMTEMDIQNLSCRFVATMNISFHLATYAIADSGEREKAKKFAQVVAQILKQKLKVTFQNDFVLNIEEDLSTNVSDSDRTIRYNMSEHDFAGTRRIYSNFIVTRQFKFGLRSDILFFPLQQNDLDLVTTLNSIKVSLSHDVQMVLRFNCMNIQMPTIRPQEHNHKELWVSKLKNSHLQRTVEDLYMHENDGKELTAAIMKKQFQQNKNNAFFRNVKISFPMRSNSTQFGYYHLIENQVQIHYTREKQHRIDADNMYQKLKNCLFCRKHIYNYNEFAQNGHPNEEEHVHLLGAEDRSLQDSYCNAIMRIPMVKASLGTIIQLCIPIFFLSFLGLVQFLYSTSTSGDQVRGQKIGSSTLIVATYISFIYAMRTVIPPTPSWSIFQVAVCILAATSLLPIIESIYAGNYNTTDNPFLVQNGLFIAAFIVNATLCSLIILMLIIIKSYTNIVTRRRKLENVSMDDLLKDLTKKYFFVWRNAHCYDFMHRKMEEVRRGRKRLKWSVRIERWREK